MKPCRPVATSARALGQRLEPVLAKALVAELAVEAPDVTVLHGPLGLDQDVPDALALGPGHGGPAGELRTVVGAHGTRVAAEPRRLAPKARDVLARDPAVGADLHALIAEVVCHGEKLDGAAAGQAIADKAHAPDFVTARASCSGTRSETGSLSLRRLRIDSFAC